ncbi:ankyrin repeat-containing domain protein [Lophiotrema nucula]|uniref:Ankyrin repeat-containing domain protein n=1 Tax=Lophiotrema nucula TaxID=690887 RepID=A0A6A5ZH59_9PLEO|nr:ankyrin repeat-containing domain protein [Lophiotrema nucula]
MCYAPALLLDTSKLTKVPYTPNNVMNPRYLLQAAVINNCPEVVRRLLENDKNDASILSRNSHPAELFGSPCWLAGRSGNLETIKILLSSSLGGMREKREQALRGAVTCGHLEAVEFVMAPWWEPINFITSAQSIREPLLCGMLNNPEVDFCFRIYELVTSHHTRNNPIQLAEHIVWTLLEQVGRSTPQRADIIAHLLDMVARANDLLYQHPQLRTELYRPLLSGAVSGGNGKIVEPLISRGATPSGTDSKLIVQAAAMGRMDIVRLLVENGFPVKRSNSTFGPNERLPEQAIARAVLVEHEEMCRYLLDHGANLDLPKSGELAMSRAKKEGLETMIEFLEARGVVLHSGD